MKQLSATITILQRAFSNLWYRWTIFLAVNALWVVGTATFILAPPALFGLFYVANEAAHNHSPGVDDFFHGARIYFTKSWQWGLLNLIAALLFWTNFNFYPLFAGQLAAPMLLATLTLLVVWFMVQLYAVPYLMEQENRSVWTALRNGLFTALASPLLTVCLGLIVGGIIAACSMQPVLAIIGAGALIALIANHAVLERLKTFGLREPEVTETPQEPLEELENDERL